MITVYDEWFSRKKYFFIETVWLTSGAEAGVEGDDSGHYPWKASRSEFVTLLYVKSSAAAPEKGPYVLWYSAQSCGSVIDYEKHEKRSCMERPRWRQIAHRNRSLVVLCSHVVPAASCNEQLPCDVLHRAEREC